MPPTSSSELRDAAWAEVADLLDLQLAPLGLLAIDALRPQLGQTILDIGCGSGQTVLQLASRVGPSGRVIGIDIAPRVLDVARQRTVGQGSIQLIQADAAVIDLPSECADAMFSRFGVMGFAEPIPSFANLRRITRRGGRLSFVTWRSLGENELDLMPLEAANLGLDVDRTPFQFEDRDALEGTLAAAGYTDISIEPRDMHVSSGSAEAMTTVLTKVGPLGKQLREAPTLLPIASAKVREALATRILDGNVALKAAVWIVSASA